ncbi:outer membrane protein transport protein [Roseomonas gilardii subsp. gilardii]|uniref:OmpP1/FadL family transporter n=1 Tax=Roseomonas gilardii TaxID=257708 RepID=UPI001FFBBDC3|nr:TonB-dependent receptor [Roseomonas gilardii]UPG73157.1 outer membrane protein transport protein [Roseomonas gilardii subsp. gilardii]
MGGTARRCYQGVVAGLATGIAIGGWGAAPAHASGYFLRDQSAIGQGSSFAGSTARADDPSMQFFNPASMVRLPGFQTSLVGTYVAPDATVESSSGRRAAALGGSTILGGTGGDVAQDAFVPATYATAQVAPDWWLGLSVNSPWGLITKTGAGDVGRYHAMTSVLRTVEVAPSVAWKATPEFSLGASLILQYMSARLSNAVDFGSIGAAAGLGRLGLTPGSADGIGSVKGDDYSVGWQIGALWEPHPGTRLGANFRSAVFQKLDGSWLSFENVPAALANSFRAARASTKVTTPESVTLGLWQDLGRGWTLLSDVSWTNWSRFQEIRIKADGRADTVTAENWRDTVFASVGAEYQVNEKLRLRTGFAYDQTPVKTAYRTPRLPDTDRYWLSAGASYKVTERLEISAGYSHIFARDGIVNLSAGSSASSPDFLRGNLQQRYSNAVDVFALQARITL